jgi:hypothetical protein
MSMLGTYHAIMECSGIPVLPSSFICAYCFSIYSSVGSGTSPIEEAMQKMTTVELGPDAAEESDDDDDEIPMSALGKKKAENSVSPQRRPPAKRVAIEPTPQTQLLPTPQTQLALELTPPTQLLPTTQTQLVRKPGESEQHAFPVAVPSLGATGKYSWLPGSVTMMKDAALAANKAAKNVFPTSHTRMHVATWAVHASVIWFSNRSNYEYFRSLVNINKTIGRMQQDFNAFRGCCFSVEMEDYLRKAMMHKWRFRYNEPDVAAQWDKVWGAHSLTRVSANQLNPNRGGFPSDNNALRHPTMRTRSFLIAYERVPLPSSGSVTGSPMSILHLTRSLQWR